MARRLLPLLLLVPSAALAQGWASSFPPDAAASWVTVADGGLIVAGAGASTPELQDATSALVEALRRSGRARVVMDSAAIGDLSSLDDAAIVKRAGALPIDEVIVVRVFPGATATAVVTHYGKDGASRGGYSAVPGTAIAARVGTSAGLTESAAHAVDAVNEEATRPLPSPPPPPARKLRSNMGWKTGLLLGGGLLASGGLVAGVVGFLSTGCTRDSLASAAGGDGSGCGMDETLVLVGGGALVAGLVMTGIGGAIPSHTWVDAAVIPGPGGARLALAGRF